MSGFSRWVMNTFFVSTNIDQFRRLLQSARSATLLIETLYQYRAEGHYLLHEFVVMPDHIHLIVSPQLTIEKSMQLIKGGFAFRRASDFSGNIRCGIEAFTIGDCAMQVNTQPPDNTFMRIR